jgi:hypothetical protein
VAALTASGIADAGPAAGAAIFNPCIGSRAQRLRCPDLTMRRPFGLYIERAGSRRRLHAGNAIYNRGRGPLDVLATRSGSSMRVTQRIYDFAGSVLNLPSPRARVVFKNIPGGPGAGRYWKFKDAAEFQLWTLDSSGRRQQLVRRGAKQVYCLRDLVRVSGIPRSPGGPVYGACSEDGGARRVVLGTSVGWADRYPSDYFQQWIDVTGLRGRFLLVQVADPRNLLAESNEANNENKVAVSLPSGVASGSSGGEY